MPRRRSLYPRMYPDRTGQWAICWFYDPGTGKRRGIRLGPWGSLKAEEEFARIAADLRAQRTPPPAGDPGLTVAELCVRFLKHAEAYYVDPGTSRRTSEYGHYSVLIGDLATIDGPAATFGPLALKSVRDRFVARGWSRTYVNDQTRRVRRMFRWAAENELVPAAVWQALASVSGLTRGRTTAPERLPVPPATAWQVGRTLKFLPPIVAAMVRVQWWSGCRTQDVCNLRWEEIDRRGKIWTYRPGSHKNTWRDLARTVYFGPHARAIIAQFAEAEQGVGYVFTPQSERSELERNTRRRKACPRRTPRSHYDSGTYGRAVHRACRAAGVEPWSPGQLRHSAATRFRRLGGLELARQLLGHRQTSTSEIYAEKDAIACAEAAGKCG